MNEPAPHARAHTHAAPISPHPVPHRVSEIFDPAHWREIDGFTHGTSTPRNLSGDLTDVTYHRGCVRDADGAWVRDLPVVRIALNRPEVRNAFRPRTVDELYRTLDHARMSGDVGAVILTGNGPSPRDGGWAFSSGGDQRIRGRDGYHYASGDLQGKLHDWLDTVATAAHAASEKAAGLRRRGFRPTADPRAPGTELSLRTGVMMRQDPRPGTEGAAVAGRGALVVQANASRTGRGG